MFYETYMSDWVVKKVLLAVFLDKKCVDNLLKSETLGD